MSTSIHHDRVGFPMVWREEVGAYVHWLPVTKMQFEYFLCDAPDAHFDADWYDDVLRLNPRVTPRKIDADNYFQALMTGVQPTEAQRFASWCGEDFRLPTEEEWTALYRGSESKPAKGLQHGGLLDGRQARARELLERVDFAVRDTCDRMGTGASLAAQMLLRFGAMEWVQTGSPPSSWGYKGEPIPDFCGNLESLDRSSVALAMDPEKSRLPAAGFRLLYVPEERLTQMKSSVNGG